MSFPLKTLKSDIVENEFEYSMRTIIANYLDNTTSCYQRCCSAEEGAGLSKEKLRAKRPRGGISMRPKWWRSGCDWRKQWRNSRYTTCNNGANICCVGRWQWFITACELSTRETNVAPMRDEPYCSMRGTSYVFIARPGNNNRLLFITPAPNAHETLCSSPHRVWFHDSLFHRFSLRRIVILNETRVEKKITNELYN